MITHSAVQGQKCFKTIVSVTDHIPATRIIGCQATLDLHTELNRRSTNDVAFALTASIQLNLATWSSRKIAYTSSSAAGWTVPEASCLSGEPPKPREFHR